MSRESAARTVVVIGGGVSGLTVAYEIAERSERLAAPVDVVCLEEGERCGGNIRSERDRDFLCEWGPNGFLDNADCTLTLVRRLGLAERMLPSRDEAARRFIFRAGALRELPTSPGAFLRSGVLPLHGRLRVLAEPLVRRRDSDDDESVFDFAARRIGRPAASVLIDAMVSGVYAGDARRLSLPATFPRMREMESEHGSLFRAMLAKRKEARESGGTASGGGPAGPGGRLTSFREGMQELTDALARALGSRLALRARVRSVSDMGVRGMRVHFEEGAPRDVDAVVLAVPAWRAAEILEGTDGEMAGVLRAIPPAPLSVVHLGYRDEAMGDRIKGFGFLVPRGQGPRILGTLWSSDIFENRAPAGSVLLTTMIGGAHDPSANDLDDDALVQTVRDDLERCMGLKASPHLQRVIRHGHGIPQYTLGHMDRVAALERRLEDHRGLWLCGNSYRGVSVNLCVEEAPKIAESVLEFLAADAASAVG